MDDFNEVKILDSWVENAAPWITAVQQKQIESRRRVTDQAIIGVIRCFGVESVLDIGCGEGWLARELSALGMSVTGIDATPAFTENARRSCSGRFHLLQYEALSARRLGETFDLAVCNFSLLGDKSVRSLFRVMPGLLNPGGRFVIQTVPPGLITGKHYRDGWRKGSWDGFSDQFRDPAPWYFRTLQSWTELFTLNGLRIELIKEPLYPDTGAVASLIMVGRAAEGGD